MRVEESEAKRWVVLVVSRIYSAPLCVWRVRSAGEAETNNGSPECYESMASMVVNLTRQSTTSRESRKGLGPKRK
jgi:hypothetical protein